ncbi:MAG: branched-chain amino acid ABC transporter permease [Cryobacterium sp.]|nr:branched-chain amino acid ABC transporter permease [Cryobacterium sp.]
MKLKYWTALGWRAAISLLAIVAAISVPAWISDAYLLHLLAVAAVMSIAAMSLNLLIGVAGQLSLAHAAFLGLGGYTTAILTTRLGWSFWETAWLAIVVGAVAGIALGAPALRLEGHYLGMVTLGAGQIFVIFLTTSVDLTKGADGISGVPAPEFGQHTILDDSEFLILFVVVAALTYLVLSALRSSQVGRAMSAIRQDEVAAASIGIAAPGYKLLAFAISSAVAAFAGSLLVGLYGVAAPSSFSVIQSILLLVMVIIGGLRSIGGAIAGATAVVLLPEYLRFLDTWYGVAFGLAIVLLVMFAPGGVGSFIDKWLITPIAKLRSYLRGKDAPNEAV